MFEFDIKVTEINGLNRQSCLQVFSVPFPNGQVFVGATISPKDDALSAQSCVYHALSYWPNGSIKWARVYTTFSVNAHSDQNVTFIVCENPSDSAKNGETVNALNDPTLADFELELTDCKGDKHSCAMTNVGETIQLSLPEYKIINQSFSGQLAALPLIEIRIEQQLFQSIDNQQSQIVKSAITIHNKASALHHEGQWDLGDQNSLQFESLKLVSTNNNEEVGYLDLLSESFVESHFTTLNNLVITQHSSGGENWNSKVHKDSKGKVPFSIKGYQIIADHSEVSGSRILPAISAKSKTNSTHVFMEAFWQNFPSSISASPSRLEICLFPKVGYLHELQPGEKKTHSVWLGENVTDQDFLSQCSPLFIVVTPKYLERTKTVPFYISTQEPQIQSLIDVGLDMKVGFNAKKELVDEYGWRNFGDLYADHENAESNSGDLIVSHYNNQYDPVFGFLRQYLSSGDRRWFALADQLAKHVIDIDIYDTELDRAEYNGGLFWHTDHYVDAETATHRTYSKNQPQNVYMDHAGGGGPGGQHCYTTGLMLHYFISGNSASKTAVLKLTDWITHVYEGSGGVLDFALALKNRNRADLKNVMTERYPLDRGTGHYIFALIDCFELTGKQSYLDRASLVIKNTVSPNDDVDQRHLDNVEETWFYTVFLQAVSRYLCTKSDNNQLDESYYYAVHVLKLFADWMAINERPYLTKSEILEFPNQTWTAQDLRKVNVLSAASHFCGTKLSYDSKINEITTFILQDLAADKNKDYCRILCILMQNVGWLDYFSSRQSRTTSYSGRIDMDFSETKSVLANFCMRVKQSSFKKELSWVASRSNKLNALLKKGQ